MLILGSASDTFAIFVMIIHCTLDLSNFVMLWFVSKTTRLQLCAGC